MIMAILLKSLKVICLCFLTLTLAENDKDDMRFGHGGIKVPVQEISEFPPPKEFFDAYVFPAKPVKISKAAVQSKAYKLWDDDYLGSLEAGYDWELTADYKDPKQDIDVVFLTFKQFVDTYKESHRYIIGPVPKFLLQDVMLPRPLQCDSITKDHILENHFWFSAGDTQSLVHTDSSDNILCLFRGTKEFILVDSIKYGKEVKLDVEGTGSYSDVDIDNVDYEKYPGLRGIEYHHVNISEGDCIYIPYRWFHLVRSYERNLAVNIWWDPHRNGEIDFEHCPSVPDLELTLDKVTFFWLNPKNFTTLHYIKDMVMEFTTQKQDLSIDDFLSFAFGETPELVTNEMKQISNDIYQSLDTNHDNLLHYNEFKAASPKTWSRIQHQVKEIIKLISMMPVEDGGEEQAENRNEL